MNVYVLSLSMTVAGNVAYHVFNKSVSAQAHPFASLVATYAIALAASIAALVIDAPSGLVASVKQVNWASYAIGAAVVAIELGFLLAYRAGWKISAAALYSNIAVGILLVPIGMLAYRETISRTNAIGIVLAVAGLALMSRK